MLASVAMLALANVDILEHEEGENQDGPKKRQALPVPCQHGHLPVVQESPRLEPRRTAPEQLLLLVYRQAFDFLQM